MVTRWDLWIICNASLLTKVLPCNNLQPRMSWFMRFFFWMDLMTSYFRLKLSVCARALFATLSWSSLLLPMSASFYLLVVSLYTNQLDNFILLKWKGWLLSFRKKKSTWCCCMMFRLFYHLPPKKNQIRSMYLRNSGKRKYCNVIYAYYMSSSSVIHVVTYMQDGHALAFPSIKKVM